MQNFRLASAFIGVWEVNQHDEALEDDDRDGWLGMLDAGVRRRCSRPNDLPIPARPGTVNYIEGAAYLNGKPLHQQSVGSVALDPGQVLTTGAGKAEILLTPGIFLRVDSNSAVKMISPDLAQTQVELERGRAGVEVDQIFPQNRSRSSTTA